MRIGKIEYNMINAFQSFDYLSPNEWDRVFDILQFLIAGGLIAWYTSHFLKKRDEVTRVKGVMLEKRIASYEELMQILYKLYETISLEDKELESAERILRLYGLRFGNSSLEYHIILENKDSIFKYIRELSGFIQKNKIFFDRETFGVIDCFVKYLQHYYDKILRMAHLQLSQKYNFTEGDMKNKSDLVNHILGTVISIDVNYFYGTIEDVVLNNMRKLDYGDGKIDRLKWKWMTLMNTKRVLSYKVFYYLESRDSSKLIFLSDFFYKMSLEKKIRRRFLFRYDENIVLTMAHVVFSELIDDKDIFTTDINLFNDFFDAFNSECYS